MNVNALDLLPETLRYSEKSTVFTNFLNIVIVINVNLSFNVFHCCMYICVSGLLLPATTIAEGEAIIREALSQADNPHHSTVTCTAGIFV